MTQERSQLNEAVQFIAIGLAIRVFPELLPYETLSEQESVLAAIYWAFNFASFMFLVRGAIKARNA